MLPPLAANAHAHAWKRATQYGDRKMRRPAGPTRRAWSAPTRMLPPLAANAHAHASHSVVHAPP
eukprot:347692-Prymnesium_polylepis.1